MAVSQPWADKWLTATPDASLAHTQPRSVLTRLGVQRRLGLYLSYAKPLYDSIASSGGDVSQSDRLGDTIINLDSKTGRHNKFNRAFYNAVSAQATTSVILGDKGDGSPRARADALARYAH